MKTIIPISILILIALLAFEASRTNADLKAQEQQLIKEAQDLLDHPAYDNESLEADDDYWFSEDDSSDL